MFAKKRILEYQGNNILKRLRIFESTGEKSCKFNIRISRQQYP
jgi:hypothetical protein